MDYFKLEKDGLVFSIFSRCPPWPSVGTDRDRKKFQCLSIVLYNKTGPLVLELNLRQVKAWVERLKRPSAESAKILYNDTEGSK